jgi:hypothetical protein
LLWLRNSSRQLLCPASRFVQSSFSTLHFVSFAIHYSCSFRLGYEPHRYSSHITTTCTRFQRQAHSTPIRFVHSSFTQQTAVHPLPLLCSPALSSGLRAVMLFAPTLCWPTLDQLLSTTNHTPIAIGAKNHASPCSVRPLR